MIINESEIYPYEASDLSDKDCLVIAPHPDDESIGCGGSIIRHIKRESYVHIVFLTSGDKGNFKETGGKIWGQYMTPAFIQEALILIVFYRNKS